MVLLVIECSSSTIGRLLAYFSFQGKLFLTRATSSHLPGYNQVRWVTKVRLKRSLLFSDEYSMIKHLLQYFRTAEIPQYLEPCPPSFKIFNCCRWIMQLHVHELFYDSFSGRGCSPNCKFHKCKYKEHFYWATAVKNVKLTCGGHVLTRMFDLATSSKLQM